MSTSNFHSKGRSPKLTSAEAQARLADALRDNLRRRKAQIRARDAKAEGTTEAPAGQDISQQKTPDDKSR